MITRKEIELGGRKFSIEIGKVAKQADGTAWVRYNDTIALVTVVAAHEARPDQGFFPLSVDYREKYYSAGKIPGGYIKREARPSEKEILSARLVDRPIRPLFPSSFMNETQVMVQIISSDQENDADVLAVIGASVAICTSDIPFAGPCAAVRVGRIDNELVINPTFKQVEESDLELVIAGSADSILMVEGAVKELTESDILEAIKFGHTYIQQIVELQNEIISEIGKEKREHVEPEVDEELVAKITELIGDQLVEAVRITDRQDRKARFKEINTTIIEALEEEYPECGKLVKTIAHDIEKVETRKMMINENVRLDGRSPDEIRDITCEVGILPRAHGSGLFTRGQTQSLGVCTLGTGVDAQRIDNLEGDISKSFMLHYNFPPFSTGEVKRVGSVSRREIGHGNLAERALTPVIPNEEIFPYTIRLVSEVLESNGSSSMASVCSNSMSLMDTGVPIKAPVAGIAMGLIKEDDNIVILSDILGDEDHLGDMDFKVAGTAEGITAVQMDIKIKGISFEIMEEALERALQGRLHILEIMNKTISSPRKELSEYAPRIVSFRIPQDTIGSVIGPGGKMIREIIETTGAKIDISDDGTVIVASVDGAGGEQAVNFIKKLVEQPEPGKTYEGTIKKIVDFGAFVEILPGKEGLLHISEISNETRVNDVNDFYKVGDTVKVKLLKVDRGKFVLSARALLPGYVEKPSRPQRDGGRNFSRDNRDRDNRDNRDKFRKPPRRDDN
ncbi:MAG: polyribonucleotide nucleotidyltransferase [Calditrichaeota bacterium]|nr:MAG: polyribonucleotide nucleotidyltransferase [Calditrichota bacterium]